MGTIEPRHVTASIFWSLSTMCVIFAVSEFLRAETDGIQVILLLGNACLTCFLGLVFFAPEPDYYDTMPIEKHPKPQKIKRNYARPRPTKSSFYRYDPCAAFPIERNEEEITAE